MYLNYFFSYMFERIKIGNKLRNFMWFQLNQTSYKLKEDVQCFVNIKDIL